MTAAVVILGVLAVVIGVAAAANPATFRRMLDLVRTRTGLYIVSLLRLVFGVLLILAAPQCRASGWVLAFGVLYLAGGVIGPLLGIERVAVWVDWWRRRPDSVIRVWSVAALGLGAFFIYAGL